MRYRDDAGVTDLTGDHGSSPSLLKLSLLFPFDVGDFGSCTIQTTVPLSYHRSTLPRWRHLETGTSHWSRPTHK